MFLYWGNVIDKGEIFKIVVGLMLFCYNYIFWVYDLVIEIKVNVYFRYYLLIFMIW